MAKTIKIPESLFTSFQAQLQAEGRKLCVDLAKTLGIPEKELISNILLKDKKIELTYDMNDGRTFCPVFIPRGSILDRCFHPVTLGTERCAKHQSITTINEPSNLISLTPLKTDEPYYMNPDTKEVYNDKGELVGIYRDEDILLFG